MEDELRAAIWSVAPWADGIDQLGRGVSQRPLALESTQSLLHLQF